MRPSLYLNFAAAPDYLDPRFTFTRNTTGTYVAPNGLIVSAPANAPRWNFDPVTGECVGILIENEATNRLTYSEQFDNVIWVSDATLGVTANAAAAPDGNTTADRLTASADLAYVYQGASVTTGKEVFTFSVFAKADSASYVRLALSEAVSAIHAWYDLTTGQVVGFDYGGSGVQIVRVGSQVFPNGWVRCYLTGITVGISTVIASVGPATSNGSYGGAGNSVFVWGGQLEDASISNAQAMSSYIPTTTASVVRAADNLSLSITPSTDTWFNSSEGTIVFSWSTSDIQPTGNTNYGGIGNSSTNCVAVGRYYAEGGRITGRFVSSAVTEDIEIINTFAINSTDKAAIAWSSTEATFTTNGAVPMSVSTNYATPATTTRMTIGFNPAAATASTDCACAAIRSFTYYREKLDDTYLMLMTS